MFSNATHFSKIANQTTHQMAVEKETFLLPRVHVYGTILCVIHAYEISVYSVQACIQSVDDLLHSCIFLWPLGGCLLLSLYIYNIINITSIALKSSGGRAQKRNKT